MSFLSRWHAQVRLAPDAVAVRANDETLTYAKLDRRAADLAQFLARLGAGPERMVGVAVTRSTALLVGLVGVLKTGAALLPLDGTYPVARLRRVIADTGCEWIVTTAERLDWMPAHVTSIHIDGAGRLDAPHGPAPAVVPLPDGESLGDHAAYAMQTSGSTGEPKAIVVSHRAFSTLIAAADERGCLVPGDRIVAVTTVAFDISLLELLVPLCFGCEVIVADVNASKDPLALARLLARHRPTVVQATPSQWRTIVQHCGAALRHIRVLAGGEPLPRDLAAQLHDCSAGVTNLYGPTEATIWASAASVCAEDLAAGAPPVVQIGAPLPGYEIYLLDGAGTEVGVGGTGEIHIGGPALARGYCGKPALTAERFVANPYGRPGERMYRAGDMATRRADGSVAFLGRDDRQVKIRGHRIELGEIEAVLLRHDAVVDAAVTAQAEQQRLLAYVVCKTDHAARASAHVAEWQGVWDATYHAPTDAPGDFNIAGWQNSFTQTPMPTEEMQAWVSETVTRIRGLRPRSVLEIGCGTGLLLSRVARHCESYLATDFSEPALSFVRRYIEPQPDLAHVELRRLAAVDLAAIADGSRDLVVLNSVVQYFPDADYLLSVLRHAVRIAGNGGRVFVGDVRNLSLAAAYHAAVQLHRAPDDLSSVELRRRVAEARAREVELLLDPEFFDALVASNQGVAQAEILPKTGPYDNELTRFRYDVVLTAGRPARAVDAPDRWIEWDAEHLWRHDVESVLSTRPQSCVGVRAIPSRRVTAAVDIARLVDTGELTTAGDIRRATVASATGEDPGKVFTLAERLDVDVAFSGVDAAGRFAAVFNPRYAVAPPADSSAALPATWANNPARNRASHVTATLRQHLRELLPAYMLPAAIVELERFPMTANAKLDRKALPVPTFASRAKYEAPASMEQEVLCDLFQEVLGVGLVGIHDNFFELGGHSLSAVRLAQLVQARLQVAVSMQMLFEAPTVAWLVEHIRETRREMAAQAVVALRATGTLPPLFCLPPVYGLSFAYAGLARELSPDRPIYCLQASGVRHGEPFSASIDEAARGYVASMRAIQPAGPYYVFGWSFGGLMAYATACLLQRQGDEVAQLAVIDAYPRATTVSERFISISNYLADIREHVREALREVDHHHIDRLLRLTVNHAILMTSFRPDVFAGRMLLVAAQDNRDLAALWEPFVLGRIDTHVVPCGHIELMKREYLRLIAPLVEDGAVAPAAAGRDIEPASTSV